MTNASTRLAAAVLAALLSAAIPPAAAAPAAKPGQSTSSNGYRPVPIIRDHRAVPQKWSRPRHHHRHDR